MDTNVNTEQIRAALIERLGFSEAGASSLVVDLGSACREHVDIEAALSTWIECELEPTVASGAHTTETLSDAMAYPAALAFIAWHRADPASADAALAVR